MKFSAILVLTSLVVTAYASPIAGFGDDSSDDDQPQQRPQPTNEDWDDISLARDTLTFPDCGPDMVARNAFRDCVACPANSRKRPNTDKCVCRGAGTIWAELGNKCVCADPGTTMNEDGDCIPECSMGFEDHPGARFCSPAPSRLRKEENPRQSWIEKMKAKAAKAWDHVPVPNI